MSKKAVRFTEILSDSVFNLLVVALKIIFFVFLWRKKVKSESVSYENTYKHGDHSSSSPTRDVYNVKFIFFDSGVEKVEYVCEVCGQIIRFSPYRPKEHYNPSYFSRLIALAMWP